MTESLAARWEQHHEAGRRALSHGLVGEAEHAFAAAVSEAELLGSDSPQLATSLTALGQLRTQTRDHGGAESALTRALSIRERAFGSDGQALVPTLNALAALYDARTELDRAEGLLQRSLAISEQHLGPSHPEVSVSLNNLAKLYFKRRDFAKADRLLLRLLEIKRALGKDHPEVATVLGSLGKLRQVVGKPDHGEQLWRQALAIRERGFAPNDPIIATTLENLADCCAALEGRVGDAVALRERAYAIRERAPVGNPATLAAARAKLDELRARDRSMQAAAGKPLPPRSSQELPVPIITDEVPLLLRQNGLQQAPPSDLPWLDLEDNGRPITPSRRVEGLEGIDRMSPMERIAPMDLLPASPPQRRRTPAASVTPQAIPRQPGSAVPVGFAPPPPPAPSLVLSDSIAPEPPRREKAREPHSDRGTRYVPPDARKPSSGRGARYGAGDPDAVPVAHKRRPRMPAEMSRRGSSKRLVVFGLVIAIVAGTGWVMRDRLETVSRPLIDRAVSLGATAERALPRRLDAAPAKRDSAPPPPAGAPARPRRTSLNGVESDSTREGSLPDDRIVRGGAARLERHSPARDSVTLVRQSSADDALMLRRVPTVGDGAEMEALTSDVEHATKAKVESAQKPLIDLKPPVFKKP